MNRHNDAATVTIIVAFFCDTAGAEPRQSRLIRLANVGTVTANARAQSILTGANSRLHRYPGALRSGPVINDSLEWPCWFNLGDA